MDPLRDRVGRDVALPDGDVERVEVAVVHRLGDLGEHFRLRDLLDRQALLAQCLLQVFASVLDRVDAPLTGEPLADLVSPLRRVHELQPVATRPCTFDLAGEDLDGVARIERRVERHEPAVGAAPMQRCPTSV